MKSKLTLFLLLAIYFIQVQAQTCANGDTVPVGYDYSPANEFDCGNLIVSQSLQTKGTLQIGSGTLPSGIKLGVRSVTGAVQIPSLTTIQKLALSADSAFGFDHRSAMMWDVSLAKVNVWDGYKWTSLATTFNSVLENSTQANEVMSNSYSTLWGGHSWELRNMNNLDVKLGAGSNPPARIWGDSTGLVYLRQGTSKFIGHIPASNTSEIGDKAGGALLAINHTNKTFNFTGGKIRYAAPLKAGSAPTYVLALDGDTVKSYPFPNGGGGGTSPAGSNTQIQYNDNGVFGADSNFTYSNSPLPTLNIINGDFTGGQVFTKYIGVANNSGVFHGFQYTGTGFPAPLDLPNTDGVDGDVLTTNGSGLLRWQTPSGGGSGWLLTGNSGNTSSNFIGNIDDVPFTVRVNNTKAGYIGNSGSSTTSWGFGALYNLTTGQANTGIGTSALVDLTTGNGNVAMGRNAGSTLIDGNWNVLLGSSADVDNASRKEAVGLGHNVIADRDSGVFFGENQYFLKAKGFRGNTGDVLTLMADSTIQLQPCGCTNVGTSTVLTQKISLSSSQILNLGTIPIQLLPAPPSGTYIEPIALTCKLNYGTTPYSNTDLNFYFNTNDIVFYDNNMLSSNSSVLRKVNPAGGNIVLSPSTSFKMMASSAVTSGNGTLDVYVTYKIVTL